MHEPLGLGPRSLLLRHQRIVPVGPVAEESEPATGTGAYDLVVVDEAHHLYNSPAARVAIERHVSETSRRLLLSDISQTVSRVVPYPDQLAEVTLSEVVRCSSRIVAGAMAFQLGGEAKLLTKCHHEITGPPLRSFLFDIGADPATSAVTEVDDEERKFRVYSRHVLRALEHAATMFSGLSLHNRVALVVPTDEFRCALADRLAPEVMRRWGLGLVSAKSACCELGETRGQEEDALEPDDVEIDRASQESGAGAEPLEPPGHGWIILDSISAMDGLERLIVVAVGLDSPIESVATTRTAKTDECASAELVAAGGALRGASPDSIDTEASADLRLLETRSMLYRALTRAQLLAMVVNECIEGGWLEFLVHVRMREDESFDASAALARTETAAVETTIRAQICDAIASHAVALGARPPGESATEWLATEAAVLQEGGTAPEEAVKAVVRGWKSAAEQAHAALLTARSALASPFGIEPTDDELDALCDAAALALAKGDSPYADLIARDALRRWLGAREAACVDEALRRAAVANKEFMRAIRTPDADTPLLSGDSSTATLRTEGEAAVDTRPCGPTLPLGALRKLVRESFGDRDGTGEGVGRHTPEDSGVPSSLAAAAESAVQAWLVAEKAAVRGLRVLLRTPESGEQELLEKARRTLRECLNVVVEDVLNGKSVEAVARPRFREWLQMRQAEYAQAAIRQVCAGEGQIEAFGGDEAMAAMVAEVVAEHAQEFDWAGFLLRDHQEPTTLPFEGSARTVVDYWSKAHDEVAAVLVRESARLQQEMPSVASLLPGLMTTMHSQNLSLAEAIEAVLEEWRACEVAARQRDALIASAIEEAARPLQLQLHRAAERKLHGLVLAAVERGEDMHAAVDAVLEDYSSRLMRQRVQQTVWDPAGNEACSSAGVPVFMPFRRGGDAALDHDVLQHVFSLLPFSMLRTLALVCKRWRAVATDPSWKPDVLVYAWGAEECSGLLSKATKPTLLPFSIDHEVRSITCADNATLALCLDGTVYHWGVSWAPGVPSVMSPMRVPELKNVVALAATPPGYYHNRRYSHGFSAAAITRAGALYTWGVNTAGQLLHRGNHVPRPRRVARFPGVAAVNDAGALRVTHVAVGLKFLALATRPSTQPMGNDKYLTRSAAGAPAGDSLVHMCGVFCSLENEQCELRECEQLRGMSLRSLCAGAFHVSALSTSGEVLTWGHTVGEDMSNGNLLGHGVPDRELMPPMRVEALASNPIAELRSSTYCTMAITIDGRVFTWGDADGDALGHSERECHRPKWLNEPPLRGQVVLHGALAYTNAAVATEDGRVFHWGGNAWEAGVAGGRNTRGPSELVWEGAPPCYTCSSIELAWRHGYVVLRKRPA